MNTHDKPVSKTDWSTELASWSDEDFIRVFHERPDLANRLRKILAEPVKRKRLYAQGSALGEFGVIPMCDQVDDELVKVPPVTVYCQHPHCQTTGGCRGPCSKPYVRSGETSPVKVPSGYVLIAEKYLEEMIGPERMNQLAKREL